MGGFFRNKYLIKPKNTIKKQLLNQIGNIILKTNNMKLYTEEQVIKAIDEARFTVNGDERYSKDEILDSLTPIELPSDE